jgi:hypothetical protein
LKSSHVSCFARNNESPFVDGPGWPSTKAHQIDGLYSRNPNKFVCMIEQCFQKSGENQGPELVRSQLSKPRCSKRIMRNMGHLNCYPLPNRKWHTRDNKLVSRWRVEAAPQLLDKSSLPGFSSHCWESLGKFSLDCWFFPWTELVRSIVVGGGLAALHLKIDTAISTSQSH